MLGADDYIWNIPADATIISQNCNSLNVVWGSTSGGVSVSVINNTSGETTQSPTLSISTIEPEYTWEGSYCGSASAGYLFFGNNEIYEAGTYDLMIPGINCDTFVNLTVTNTQPVLSFLSSDQTCEIEGFFDLQTSSTFTDCDEDDGIATVTITGGITNPTFAWSNGETGTLITDLMPGFYSVTATDTETNCQSHENVEVIEDPSCSVRISGTTFLNIINEDCVTDTTTIPFAFIQLMLSDGQINFSDENGFYEFTTDPGDYIISAISPFSGINPLCYDNLAVSAPEFGVNYGENNFYFTNLPLGDLVVKLVKPNARPGFEQRPRVCLMNVGGQTLSGTLTFQFPSEQSFVSAEPSEDNYDATTQTLTWNFVDIPPATIWIYRPVLLLPVGTPLGTPLTYTATADAGSFDDTPEDNTITCTIPVTGSFDPNDKAVFPAGEGVEGFIPPTDTSLSYTVRFQNTGTDTAFTVLIRDTLSAEVDVRSLFPGPASHSYTAKVVDGNVLELLFENIMLPDSFVNEPASNGFVIFDIDLLPNRTLGTVIENRAAIFFDFNAPIITNEVKNTIMELVATTRPDTPIGLHLAPNPVHSTSILRFELLEAENLEINVYDLLGNLQENLAPKEHYQAGEHQINIGTENYPTGVYFITIKTGKDQMATVKMVRL